MTQSKKGARATKDTRVAEAVKYGTAKRNPLTGKILMLKGVSIADSVWGVREHIICKLEDRIKSFK